MQSQIYYSYIYSLPQSINYATFTSIQFFLCFFACSLAYLFTRVPVCWCACLPAFSTTCLNSGCSRLVTVAIGRHDALLRLAASALRLASSTFDCSQQSWRSTCGPYSSTCPCSRSLPHCWPSAGPGAQRQRGSALPARSLVVFYGAAAQRYYSR